MKATLTEVTVFLPGEVIADHLRSWVPADVELHREHARALRLAATPPGICQAPASWSVPAVDLSRHDAAVGIR